MFGFPDSNYMLTMRERGEGGGRSLVPFFSYIPAKSRQIKHDPLDRLIIIFLCSNLMTVR